MSSNLELFHFLRADHAELRRLMAEMKSADTLAGKREIFCSEFLPMLESHTCAEEETLIARSLTEEALRECAAEGLEEHDLTEFEAGKIKLAATEEQWLARWKVLCELLEHHLEEEERDFFPLAESLLGPSEKVELGLRYSEARARHRLAPVIQLPLRTFALEPQAI